MSSSGPVTADPSEPSSAGPPGGRHSAAGADSPPDGGRRSRVPRRRAWDVLSGLALILIAALVLGDVVVASVVSVVFLGWTLLLGGIALAVLALFTAGRGSLWTGLLSSTAYLVIGLVFLRNPKATLLALTLCAGALLVANGITRIVVAVREPEDRLVVMASGLASVVVGLMILNRWPESALWLLGTLLGIQLLVDGVALLLLGRDHRTEDARDL